MIDPFTASAASAAIAAAAVYIARTAYKYVVRTQDNGHNGKNSKLQEAMNAQTELLKEIKGDVRDTRDGIRELVAMWRAK